MTVIHSHRAHRNANRAAQSKLRAVPRITKGNFTFAKAKQEVEHRGFTVLNNAETHWNSQIGVQSSHRRMLVSVQDSDVTRKVQLYHILNGYTCAAERTTAEKESTRLKKQQQAHRTQQNWKESAAIQAAMPMLGIADWLPVPDGLAADLVVPRNDDGTYVGIQIKSAVENDDEVTLNVKKVDGLPGARYENLIIIGVILQYMTPDEVKQHQAAMMNDPEHVPAVTVKEVFLYKDAADIPGNRLQPHPRRTRDDKYGDSRYVVGFDDPSRLQVMRDVLQTYVANGKARSLQDYWFTYGHGTANPSVGNEHVSEMLNCKAFSLIVGFETLSAPLRQNETCDVIWNVSCTEAILISLKTASVNGGSSGYMINLKKGKSSGCHVVLAFYVDRQTQERTHVSILCPVRVYARPKSSQFIWSKRNNIDVSEQRIDLRNPDRAAVASLILKSIRALLD